MSLDSFTALTAFRLALLYIISYFIFSDCSKQDFQIWKKNTDREETK